LRRRTVDGAHEFAKRGARLQHLVHNAKTSEKQGSRRRFPTPTGNTHIDSVDLIGFSLSSFSCPNNRPKTISSIFELKEPSYNDWPKRF
jgi:hypothetical protein